MTVETRISVSSDVCHGKPCVKGTRIMVSQVLDLLAARKTAEQIVTDYYPDLSLVDVEACVRFAQKLVDNEDIEVVSTPSAA